MCHESSAGCYIAPWRKSDLPRYLIKLLWVATESPWDTTESGWDTTNLRGDYQTSVGFSTEPLWVPTEVPWDLTNLRGFPPNLRGCSPNLRGNDNNIYENPWTTNFKYFPSGRGRYFFIKTDQEMTLPYKSKL